MADYITHLPKVFFAKQLIGLAYYVYKWLPKAKVLGNLINKDSRVDFYVADLLLAQNSSGRPALFSSYKGQLYTNPNIQDVWPECEGKGLIKFFQALGQFNKTDGLSVKKMSSDPEDWGSNVVVFGAQTGRCRDFFRLMKPVGYRIEDDGIYDNETNNKIITLPDGHGYGLIIKARNPMASDENATAFLLGGYGVLGTEAAIEYFFKSLDFLGKKFGEKDFSIIVKKEIGTPEGKVERLEDYDKSL